MLDALETGLFPVEVVASVQSSAPRWADETVLCSFDELTGTQAVMMILITSLVYSDTLDTRSMITAIYPYAVDTDISNNRSDR